MNTTSPRPFGQRLPDLAVIASHATAMVVALPDDNYRPRGAVTASAGGFYLWLTDSRSSVLTMIAPRRNLLAEEMLVVMQMVRECDVELSTVEEMRAFLKCAMRDVRKFGHQRLQPGYTPPEYDSRNQRYSA